VLTVLSACWLALTPGAGGADPPAVAESAADGAGSAGPIEFWTIEPNEGQSAGGHSAIRVGDLVHHLEHREDGLILDRRDPRAAFERAYRFEGNRSIGVLRLDLPPEVARDLVARLELRRFERRIRIDRLVGVEAEVAWLDQAVRTGRAAVTVPGLGVLDPEPKGCSSAASAPLLSLREALRARLEADSLEHRLAEARRALARSRDPLMGAPPSASRHRSGGAAVAQAESGPGGPVRRLAEAVQTVQALEAILHCRGPAPSRIRILPDRSQSSSMRGGANDVANGGARENERADVRAARIVSTADVARTAKARLLGDLAQLIRSDRPDPGLALLLGWARLVVLERSIAEGRLAVLDPFAEGDAAVSLRALGASEMRLRERTRAARAVVDARRIELAESVLPLEQRLERLESAQHDLAHALRGERHRAPDPTPDGTRSRAARYASARIELPWSGGVSLEGLAARRDAARRQAQALRRSIEQDLDYDLFSRNCSTELMAVLDAALATAPSTADFARARRRDPEAVISFIPVVAGRVVARNAPVASRTRLSSARTLAARRAAAGAGAAGWVALRESNTITSKIYRPHPNDSVFVFFSESPIWARPLAGVGNLVAGLGGVGLGLLTAPWDGGELAKRGLRGIAMSVPELLFFSVRKGSFVIAPGWPSPGMESPSPGME